MADAPQPVDGMGAESFAAVGDRGMPPATPTAEDAPNQPPDAGIIVIIDEKCADVELVCFLPAAEAPGNVLVGQAVSPAYRVAPHCVIVFVKDDHGGVMGQDDDLIVVSVTRVVKRSRSGLGQATAVAGHGGPSTRDPAAAVDAGIPAAVAAPTTTGGELSIATNAEKLGLLSPRL